MEHSIFCPRDSNTDVFGFKDCKLDCFLLYVHEIAIKLRTFMIEQAFILITTNSNKKTN